MSAVITDRPQSFHDGDPAVVSMIRNDFGEQPGLRLERKQAARFWSLPQPVCDQALQSLVDAHYLVRDALGRYRRS